ncbi:hypothetical protein [Ralstonia chuxiongensis]|uniref:Uncharacterized protein n=1 Tax=Ralstonia chuxiongensis TaxID=2957504 RepID=A0AA41WSP4_9RALS|nr:hypothetical protein [Ralstonia chuxiongensis]MCP1174483.1 hypothetical protein [Ralstonia chuxiongensis]
MGLQPGGAEGKVLAKATTVEILWEIRANSREWLAVLEEKLGLCMSHESSGVVPTGDRFLKLLNPKRSALPAAKLVQVVRNGWKYAWLSDDYVFELGLRDAIRAKHAVDVLERRDRAYEIFSRGLERMQRGVLPLASGGRKGGTPKLISDDLEARRTYDTWIEEIRALGGQVMDAEEWLGWFEVSDSRKSMQATAEEWDRPECPPWVGEHDYWDALYPPYHPLLLDRLILVCDGDLPYSPYPQRIRRPERGSDQRRMGDSSDSDQILVEGDDLTEFINLREQRARHAAEMTEELLSRLQRSV